MNEIDVAWAAGVFEGEGSFNFDSRTGQSSGVRIQMTDLDVLEKMQSLFGGTIGTAYEAKGNWKKCYYWYLGSISADNFVKEIYPYLMSRRKARADEWLNSVPERRPKGRRDKAQQIIKHLESGMTQKEIADKFDVTQPYVSKLAKIAKQ